MGGSTIFNKKKKTKSDAGSHKALRKHFYFTALKKKGRKVFDVSDDNIQNKNDYIFKKIWGFSRKVTPLLLLKLQEKLINEKSEKK